MDVRTLSEPFQMHTFETLATHWIRHVAGLRRCSDEHDIAISTQGLIVEFGNLGKVLVILSVNYEVK